MFFFNGRIRNAHIVPVIVRDRPYTHKVGHSCIIVGCLSIIIGLILIVIGVISETKKTTFIGIGIISLGIGLFLTTLVCFYAQLNMCYHNWAYGPHVVPIKIESTQTAATASAMSMPNFSTNPRETRKIQPTILSAPTTQVTMLSNVGINKVIITPSIKITKTVKRTDNVTSTPL